MKTKVADLLVDILQAAGVKRVYGVVGDSLNGITDAIRRSGKIEWIHVRHEEVAAFAAGAEAHLTGSLAVCAGSCGPGNLHLINGLYDCQRSRVPVLALAAHIPSNEVGSGYFQETHPERLFLECSHYCELISQPGQMQRTVEMAIQNALARRGVSVVVISGDTALKRAEAVAPRFPSIQTPPVIRPADADLQRAAQLLNAARKVTILGGAGCASAHAELLRAAGRLQAPVVHALRGKEFIEYDNPFDVGMTGLIGHASGYHAMMDCDCLLLLGTDFPYQQFYPTGAKIIQVDLRPENIGRRCRVDLGLMGDVRETLNALLPLLDEKKDRAHLDRSLARYAADRKGLDDLATGAPGKKPVHPQFAARAISETAADDAIFTCDVGTPTIWAARYLRMNGRRRLLGSFNHGSMANALPQAIGAQLAFPGRQVVTLSGDGGLAMLMGDLLSLVQLKTPVKIVIFNNGTLGFVELEMRATGWLPYGTDLLNPNFAKVAESVGLKGFRVEDPAELRPALQAAFAHDGPAVVDVVVHRTELSMPPAITAEQAIGFNLYLLKAVMNGRGDEIIELARTNLLR